MRTHRCARLARLFSDPSHTRNTPFTTGSRSKSLTQQRSVYTNNARIAHTLAVHLYYTHVRLRSRVYIHAHTCVYVCVCAHLYAAEQCWTADETGVPAVRGEGFRRFLIKRKNTVNIRTAGTISYNTPPLYPSPCVF